MKTNEAGLDLIKHYEGRRLTSYLCPAQVWTVGYGAIRYFDGEPVPPNVTITEQEADDLLRRDLIDTEDFVSRLIRVPLTENQFSATVSLVFNIGAGNFQRSQIRQRINRKNYDGAASIWWQWRRGGGRILPGLVKRRESERQLWMT
jgi:lysozyme